MNIITELPVVYKTLITALPVVYKTLPVSILDTEESSVYTVPSGMCGLLV